MPWRTQYYDSTGWIANQSTFGGSYVDTDAFPANGCNDSYQGAPADPVCLTDAAARDLRSRR